MMYVGYGSNLDPRDWTRYCSSHGVDPAGLKAVTPVLILDHRLTFNHRSGRWDGGAANITFSPDDAVPAMAFDIDDERIWNVLDAKEGVSDTPEKSVYERCEVLILLPEGNVELATTYRVTQRLLDKRAARGAPRHVEPSEAYLKAVMRGLTHHGLPTSHLAPAAMDETCPPFEHVFVYGTLLGGEEREHVLETCERRDAWAEATLVDLGRDYPGLVPGGGPVHGELVALPEDGEVMLARLDSIEGFHAWASSTNLYRRGFIQTNLGAERRWAWTYWWNGASHGNPLMMGDWRQR